MYRDSVRLQLGLGVAVEVPLAAQGFRLALAFFPFYDIIEKLETAKSKRNRKNRIA